MTLASTMPIIYSASDAAKWKVAVSPYLYQLSNLKLLFTGKLNFADFYYNTNPFVVGLLLSFILGNVLWGVSVWTKNTSQVDRLWLILPTAFSLHFLFYGLGYNIASRRLMIMAFLQTLWSARLTYNYYRKGGYNRGAEDYRWVRVRQIMPKWIYPLFHYFYIHIFQVLHLYLLASPTYIAMLAGNERAFGAWDWIALELFMFMFVLEMLADQQQWDYYEARNHYNVDKTVPPRFKYDLLSLGRGFNATGLFRWSRHPNFLAEQLIWLSFYLFGAIASESLLNWTIFAWLGLVGVFQGSTRLTEKMSCEKYPLYRVYQDKVGRFFPRLDGSHWDIVDDDASLKED
ncbi:Steroid oxidoreductase superfamily protein [Schizosaccharomyces pombe]